MKKNILISVCIFAIVTLILSIIYPQEDIVINYSISNDYNLVALNDFETRYNEYLEKNIVIRRLEVARPLRSLPAQAKTELVAHQTSQVFKTCEVSGFRPARRMGSRVRGRNGTPANDED